MFSDLSNRIMLVYLLSGFYFTKKNSELRNIVRPLMQHSNSSPLPSSPELPGASAFILPSQHRRYYANLRGFHVLDKSIGLDALIAVSKPSPCSRSFCCSLFSSRPNLVFSLDRKVTSFSSKTSSQPRPAKTIPTYETVFIDWLENPRFFNSMQIWR